MSEERGSANLFRVDEVARGAGDRNTADRNCLIWMIQLKMPHFALVGGLAAEQSRQPPFSCTVGRGQITTYPVP